MNEPLQEKAVIQPINEDSFNFNIVVSKDPNEVTGEIKDDRKQDLDELLNELGDDDGQRGSPLPYGKSITNILDKSERRRIGVPNAGSTASFGNEDAFTDMYS